MWKAFDELEAPGTTPQSPPRAATARIDGQLLCPEGAATAAALRVAHDRGLVHAGEQVLLSNCATAYKYPLPA